MKTFGGPVLFLDRSDINTDEIIPAKYLTEITKEDLKPYILEDLKLPGFDPKSPQTKNARVIISRANFGCGSSREHAPWVFEVNGITAVIAATRSRSVISTWLSARPPRSPWATIRTSTSQAASPIEVVCLSRVLAR